MMFIIYYCCLEVSVICGCYLEVVVAVFYLLLPVVFAFC
jgi:hypothetical protein